MINENNLLNILNVYWERNVDQNVLDNTFYNLSICFVIFFFFEILEVVNKNLRKKMNSSNENLIHL